VLVSLIDFNTALHFHIGGFNYFLCLQKRDVCCCYQGYCSLVLFDYVILSFCLTFCERVYFDYYCYCWSVPHFVFDCGV
jgi:hypothetical protein